MKKDDKLERAFDEYFGETDLPENLPEDAKKLNIRRKPLWTRFTRYASALACALVVCIAAAIGIYSGVNYTAEDGGDYSGGSSSSVSGADGNDYSSGSASGGSAPDDGAGSSGAADEPSGGSSDGGASSGDSSSVGDSGDFTEYYTYSLDDLISSELSESEIAEIDSLAIIGLITENADAQTESSYAYYEKGELILFKAEITVTGEESQKIIIYVEFTEESYICEDLTDYYDYDISYTYGNIDYLYYYTESGGETSQYVLARVNGVKYYLCVTSADGEAYLTYIGMLNKI